MKTSAYPLIERGILNPPDEVRKDKINLVARERNLPFVEMVWVSTGGDIAP